MEKRLAPFEVAQDGKQKAIAFPVLRLQADKHNVPAAQVGRAAPSGPHETKSGHATGTHTHTHAHTRTHTHTHAHTRT